MGTLDVILLQIAFSCEQCAVIERQLTQLSQKGIILSTDLDEFVGRFKSLWGFVLVPAFTRLFMSRKWKVRLMVNKTTTYRQNLYLLLSFPLNQPSFWAAWLG